MTIEYIDNSRTVVRTYGFHTMETKYCGPTNFKGSRISVKCSNGERMIFDCVDDLNPAENHREAVRKFVRCHFPQQVHETFHGFSTERGYIFSRINENVEPEKEEYEIQQCFNGRWETVTHESTREAAQEMAKNYRSNCPQPVRIVRSI